MEEQLLKDYNDLEKGAYLGAIASIATADRQASDEEYQFIEALAETANVSDDQKAAILNAAKDSSNVSIKKCLDTLKNSELKYSLLTDLISFAKSDGNYSTEEEHKIQEMAQYLNINQEQFGTINTFVDKSTEATKNGEDVTQPGFLSSSGLGNMFQKVGIPSGGLFKGLIGMLAPILIGKMLSGRSRGGNSGGGLGGAIGGMLGGGGGGNIGGMLGGNSGGLGGGLLGSLLGGDSGNTRLGQTGGGFGSIFSMLNGGKGYGGIGNVLGSLFGGNKR